MTTPDAMRQRHLGRTGLEVSELCLGAMTFGREADEALSHRMLDRFVERGGTFIDTADTYSAGRSEEVLGTWLATKARYELVIATKVRFWPEPGPNRQGLGRKHIMAGVEASLRRLKTDHIDLYQVHMWDENTPLEETLSTLDTLVRSGKVRYIGLSNFFAWQIQKALDLSRAQGWEPFVSVQPLYNLLDRELEWEILPLARVEGLGVLPWSPLRGGWLSGRYHRGMTAPHEGTRIQQAQEKGWSENWTNYANDHTWGVLDTLGSIAKESGRSMSQVALNWLLSRPGVTAPILGARNLEQLDDNLGAGGWDLTPDQVAALDKASAKPLPYPAWFINGR